MAEQTITALPGQAERPRKNGIAAKQQAHQREQEAAFAAMVEGALRERNRWALTARSRAHREQQFAVALKAVMKDLSVSAVDAISDRELRVDTRVKLYKGLGVFAKEMTKEHTRLADRARAAMLWSIVSVALLIAATGVSLYGWLG